MPATNAGTAVYYVMLPLAVAGIVIFRRRRIRQWYLLVPGSVSSPLVCAVVYGLIRFRAPFEVCHGRSGRGAPRPPLPTAGPASRAGGGLLQPDAAPLRAR